MSHKCSVNRDLDTKPECAVYVLDGGLGTTLEDVYHKDISGPLWSASLVQNEPSVIVNAHLAFLRAGARVITTSTYQCSFDTFSRSSRSRDNAQVLMCKAVELAVEAKNQYLRLNTSLQQTAIKIALSLGPFGASLTPAQEFDGFYPPPYGPKGYAEYEFNTNAFADGKTDDEARAKLALEEFHYERLRVYADVRETWDKIDFLAFETVPLAREVLAIRRAVGKLAADLRKRSGACDSTGNDTEMKPWWISTVWPNGIFPQESTPGGLRLSVPDVLHALIADCSPENPVPTAIGVNCTSIDHLSSIIQQFRHLLPSHAPSEKRPSLVMYPNAGYAYDTVTKSWSLPSDEALAIKEWANAVASVVRRERSSGVWGSVVVGGCCKASPGHIEELAKVLSK